MPNFGPTELIIILIIVVLLFGVGRVGKIGGELGSAVANFRKGMQTARRIKGPRPPKPTPSPKASRGDPRGRLSVHWPGREPVVLRAE